MQPSRFRLRFRSHARFALALALAVGVASSTRASDALATTTVPLSIEKQASFVRDPATGAVDVEVRVGADPLLAVPLDPGCPQRTSVRIAYYRDNRVHGEPDVELPCTGWRRSPLAWTYDDPSGSAGGVRHLRIGASGLLLRATARGASAVSGPLAHAQVWLRIGEQAFLVRFHRFSRNDAGAVIARRPSREAGRGEAAFWSTLLGDSNRSSEAITSLERAVSRDARDGRSHFLLGMMHLQRFELLDADPRQPSRPGVRAVVAAHHSLERASALLWDGVHGDSRVPGFAAAAAYKAGIALGDPELVEQGREAMNRAADSNPLFNGFIPFGAGPIASPTSPEYATILHLLDEVFPSVFADCIGQSEICGNAGFAPHNLEGTFLLFGDLNAKAGRTEKARSMYEGAANLGAGGGWNPRFVAHARALAAGIDERVALYGDADPSNDPPFTDLGGAGSCAYCHNR